MTVVELDLQYNLCNILYNHKPCLILHIRSIWFLIENASVCCDTPYQFTSKLDHSTRIKTPFSICVKEQKSNSVYNFAHKYHHTCVLIASPAPLKLLISTCTYFDTLSNPASALFDIKLPSSCSKHFQYPLLRLLKAHIECLILAAID